MTVDRTNDQTSQDQPDRDDRNVMTEAEQAHGTGGQTANVAAGVGRTGALESQRTDEEVDERGAIPPA